MRRDVLVPCPGCGRVVSADEGHRLCRECEGYREPAPSLAARHQEHYRTCNCLADSGVCCVPTCACRDDPARTGDEVPPPTLSQTFSWCDGDDVAGECRWVTVEAPFDGYDEWEPRAYLVETWERTAAEVRWAFPRLSACEHGDCDEDAVAWQREGDTWLQACEQHRTEGGDE